MRSYILAFAIFFTWSFCSFVYADPGKDESGKGRQYQTEQYKDAWKREQEREREEAKDRHEYERENRKQYKEMAREERKHYEEMERERRKQLTEILR